MDSHVNGLLDAMSEDLTRVTRDRGIKRPIMIGIHTGGAWIAQRLHDLMNFEEPLGLLTSRFTAMISSASGSIPESNRQACR